MSLIVVLVSRGINDAMSTGVLSKTTRLTPNGSVYPFEPLTDHDSKL